MKLARFWTKERAEAKGPRGRISTVARGWSNQSIEDARQVARDLAQKVATRLASGEAQRNQYSYGDRPLPEPVIREIARVSRPGQRIYSRIADLPRSYNGLGIAILSTPRGVMSDNEARVAKVGGEVLCRVF